jgi:hypothetical protein
VYDECGTASLSEHFGEMLFIVVLMLSLIQMSYFTAAAPTARLSAVKDRILRVFLLFFQAGLRVPLNAELMRPSPRR